MVTGGTGAVDIAFAMDLLGTQTGTTDPIGYVDRNEIVASLELDGSVVLLFDQLRSLGPNMSFDLPTAKTACRHTQPGLRHLLLRLH